MSFISEKMIIFFCNRNICKEMSNSWSCDKNGSRYLETYGWTEDEGVS